MIELMHQPPMNELINKVGPGAFQLARAVLSYGEDISTAQANLKRWHSCGKDENSIQKSFYLVKYGRQYL
jgi:hypothetical protein